ncbi:MAG TPA: esterase-like activity of phytase family protein [Pseudolabrys sp.]
MNAARQRRRWFIVGILLAALLGIAGSYAVAQSPRTSRALTRIDARATQIKSFDNRDPAQTRFGALEFRGGLALTSNDPAFGGISALRMEPDGSHFLALTDNGSWLRARIVYEDGKPIGIADAEMAPMLGSDGKPLAARGWFDTESLAEAEGMLYVGIERVEKIVRFNYRRDGLLARGEPIKVPDDFKTFTFNKSLECLAVPPPDSPLAGELIAVTERSLDAQGNHRSYLLKGDHVARFSVKRSDDFDVSDCTILPPADLLLLERSYSRLRNIRMRIRRIPLGLIKPDTLVDGKVLIAADFAYQIDNMEGIGVHRNAANETIITLVSDDNFSFIQRNLLLQFALVGG